MNGAVDVENNELLPRPGRCVAPGNCGSHGDRLIDGDETVENVGAPVDAIAMHSLVDRVAVRVEAVQYAHTIRQACTSHTHHCGVKAEEHCACNNNTEQFQRMSTSRAIDKIKQ